VGELRIPAALTGINPEAEGAEFWDATNGYTAYLGVSATAPRVPFTKRSLHLYDTYKERYKTTPILTIGSYDTVLLLAEAIERAKTLESDAVVAELEKTDFDGSKGRIVFDKRHDAIFGPGYVGYAALQWLPDGSHAIWWATKDAEGNPYPGVSEFVLPPWMVERWGERK
jgi:branched-chain amino acid transport system substrate-binding protein